MASNRSYTIIGLFLLGAIVLLVAAVLAFGGTRLLSSSRQAVIFFDQSVLGLSSGSRVLFRGVQIGTVKRVQLRLEPDAGKARIAVTVEITGEDVVLIDGTQSASEVTTDELVRRGLRAQLVVYSYVTSQLAVNLDFRPDSKPRFMVDADMLELPEIPSVPSEIEQLKDTVSDLPWRETLATVNETMQSMVTLANDMDALINRLGPKLEQTTESASDTLDVARSAIAASSGQLEKTMAGFRELSSTINEQIVSRDDQVDRLLANAEQTSAHLNEMSKNLQALTEPGSATRQDMQSALRDLAAGASSLRRFAETLERDPNAILFGGSR